MSLKVQSGSMQRKSAMLHGMQQMKRFISLEILLLVMRSIVGKKINEKTTFRLTRCDIIGSRTEDIQYL